jgi:hypothetical protein
MHLLDAAGLADELRRDELSEKQKLAYMVAMVVVGLLLGRSAGMEPWTLLGAAVALLQLGIAVGGVWYCFAANQRGDGRSFIERFVCLGVPLWIWWAVANYTLYFLGLAIAFLPAVSRTEAWYRSFPILASLVLGPLYYLALARYVARAAGAGGAVGGR